MKFWQYIQKLQYKIWQVALMLLVISGLQSCKDDFVLDDPSDPSRAEIEGDCLSFIMKLDKDITSRADDPVPGFGFTGLGGSATQYENYIDTQDKFRIFFFTAEGDFLFGANDRVVGSYANNDNAASYWYVRIPMTMLVDREGNEYDIDKIKNYLKNHPFKIAVLANWPNGGEKVNPADWDDSEGNGSSSENPSSTLKGNPQWNWSNSVLNIETTSDKIRNINDLHHVYNDVYYGDDSRASVYQEFMAYVTGTKDDNGYHMGEPTDWVKMRDIMGVDATGEKGWRAEYDLSEEVSSFDSKATANQWIRANWTPEVTPNQDKEVYRHYQHMWFLWNFDASYKYGLWQNAAVDTKKEYEDKGYNKAYENNWGWNDNSPAKVTNPWGAEWYGRNGQILYEWMKPSVDNGTNLNSKLIDIGETNNDVFFRYVQNPDKPAKAVSLNGNYGIMLPSITLSSVNDASTGIIKFQARTSGTLRVKWSSSDGNQASLAVQRNLNTTPYIHQNYSLTTPADWQYNNLNYIDITIEDNSVPIYIYCTKGNAVIYSVEFIRGRYLYETDREGVVPNANQGIPMYGVQDFEPIGDWQRGTTFNLPGTVSLIRALAKVEVYIQASFGEPRHVYMRNMNRAARCEPIDVHTSTNVIWNNLRNDGTPASPSYSSTHDNDHCEWFRIQKYGASYRSGVDNTREYSDWLSWFYGSWQTGNEEPEEIHWKSEGDQASYRYSNSQGRWVPSTTLKGWQKSSFNYSKYTDQIQDMEDKTPPHVFNPYIYPSLFCRFLFEGFDTQGGGYYKYVLYIPEKNIDDPATAGKMNATPRVPHIEYRFYPPTTYNAEGEAVADLYSNTEYNLDDNQCYRIYFTNYGYDTQHDLPKENTKFKNGTVMRDQYDNYEKSTDNLSYHWPIMRNHVYKFYVGGEGPQNPEIHVQVSDWAHKKVVVEW
ncbi:MAG: hypothetical protein J1F12_08825 [Muribaculaceae bacterium]|nr:hypothetical protein [Muribaculaceae bacterium]